MSWTDLRDEILEELKDKFVVYRWNGIPSDNSGRKEVYYLSTRTKEVKGKEIALAGTFIDLAKHFDTAEEAKAFLDLQNVQRPHPLGEDWTVDTVADVTLKTGGPCATHGALFGRPEPKGEIEAPATPRI